MKFRDLKAEEIEVRIQSTKDNGLVLLLYMDSRACMNILDETVGAENWQREHYECKGNLYCRVGIKCREADIDVRANTKEILRDEWVWKSDCGAESNTEAQKGEASDSFKRACFNWGVGRELYTSPFIWVGADKCDIKDSGKKANNGKPIFVCYDNFTVKKIIIENKQIIALAIWNENKKCWAFVWQKEAKK